MSGRMAFLGYTYEGAEAAEILEYTRQGEVAAAYPFYRMEQWLMQGDMKFMPLSRGMIAGSALIRLSLRKEGEYLDDLTPHIIQGRRMKSLSCAAM